MTHNLRVVWPDHAFTTSDQARQLVVRALSEASKALGVSEPRVLMDCTVGDPSAQLDQADHVAGNGR